MIKNYKKGFTHAKRGFTLIELLIVIAVMGILATAVLSAINPMEQMRKARDAGRKSDAAELLNAYERYYTTFGAHSWGAGGISAANPVFTTGGNSEELITSNELKSQFADRDSLAVLYVTEATDETVSVCFEPESKTARLGGMGKLQGVNTGAGTLFDPNECPDPDSYPTGDCFICLPQ